MQLFSLTLIQNLCSIEHYVQHCVDTCLVFYPHPKLLAAKNLRNIKIGGVVSKQTRRTDKGKYTEVWGKVLLLIFK